MDAPIWALTVAYWLHMLATVIWIGGLASLTLLVIPAARKTIPQKDYGRFLEQIQNRLQQIGWFSLAILISTGMFQMSSHPEYVGLLAISNSWAVAILLKHLVIGIMVVVSGVMTWVVLPAIRRMAMIQSAGGNVDPGLVEKLHKQESWLLRVNLVLSIIVLLMTAAARSV